MGERISGERPTRRSRLVIPIPQPAAGADWSLTVPAGHVYQVIAVQGILSTSAVVATRIPRLVLGDGVRTFLTLPPAASVAASGTTAPAWFEAAGAIAVGVAQSAPTPRLVLPAGWTIGTNTAAIDAGDQWFSPFVWVLDSFVHRGDIDLDDVPDLTVELLYPVG